MCWTGARIGLALVVVLVACSQAFAQGPTCKKVQAVQGTTGYQARRGDQRCEGFYQSRVSGTSPDLLSLTVGPVDYQLNQHGVLRITAPDVSQLKSDQVHVEARALAPGTYYRMDATIRSAQSMTWPMAEVLEPEQLAPKKIGVVAWIEQNAHKIYIPVRVSDGSGPAPNGTPIIAIMRATADIEAVRWRLDGSLDWNKEPRVRRMGEPIEGFRTAARAVASPDPHEFDCGGGRRGRVSSHRRIRVGGAHPDHQRARYYCRGCGRLPAGR
jgi:hypothetical protein